MECSVDFELAASSARSFSQAAGLGCVLSYPDGRVIAHAGYVCQECALCGETRSRQEGCDVKHRHALEEAERFGGKYVYFCPHGLGFSVSPIMGPAGCEAKMMAGPFLMADAEDYLSLELSEYFANAPEKEGRLRALLSEVPFIAPARVSAVSNMLFLAAGFVSSAQEVSLLRLQEASGQLQGQISAYVLQMKQEERVALYPYEKERDFLEAMGQNRRRDANRLLNELLGVILFISGMSFARMKSHINELLVLMSRKAVENGADPGQIQHSTHQFYQELLRIQAFEELCFWLSEVVNRLMSLAFDFGNSRYASPLQRVTSYIRNHLSEKLPLARLASEACLSPAYFSRVFKKETGKTIQQYIVEERLRKAVCLMRKPELSLLEITGLVGFCNQSQFSRLFKRAFGDSPVCHRKKILAEQQKAQWPAAE